MLSKAKFPNLNRKARRNIKAHMRSLQQGAGVGKLAASALLHDLFVTRRIVGDGNITGGRDRSKAEKDFAEHSEHMRGAVV